MDETSSNGQAVMEKVIPAGETKEQRKQRNIADYERRIAEWWQVGDKAAPWPMLDASDMDDE